MIHTVFLSLTALAPQADRPYPLMVGDPAPKLEVSSWIGEPVNSFQAGHVYVLDFFATWCGPCRDSMPAMSALQTKYATKATFIAVDVWDYQDRVLAFVKEMGSKLNYRVALDKLPGAPPEGTKNVPMWGRDNGSSSNAWMNASGRSDAGIPTIFVVDKAGRLAWIGEDPVELNKVLAQVVEGSWNLTEASARYAEAMVKAKQARVIEKEFRDAMRAKNFEAQIIAADKLIAFDPQFHHYAGTRFQTTLLELKRKDEAYAFAREQLKTNTEPTALGQMAYVVVFMSSPGPSDLELAEKLASRANELAKGERPGPLETLARIAFLEGNRLKAAQFQAKAIAKIQDPEAKKEAEARLAEYKGGN